MTAKIKIRQLVEFEIEVDDHDGWEFEMEDFDRKLVNGEVSTYDANGEVTVLLTEVVSREHEVNYVLDADLKAEMYYLLADRERVFAHRDHNEVVREYGRRTGTEVTFSKDASTYHKPGVFLDYGDPDEAWATINNK